MVTLIKHTIVLILNQPIHGVESVQRIGLLFSVNTDGVGVFDFAIRIFDHVERQINFSKIFFIDEQKYFLVDQFIYSSNCFGNIKIFIVGRKCAKKLFLNHTFIGSSGFTSVGDVPGICHRQPPSALPSSPITFAKTSQPCWINAFKNRPNFKIDS